MFRRMATRIRKVFGGKEEEVRFSPSSTRKTEPKPEPTPVPVADEEKESVDVVEHSLDNDETEVATSTDNHETSETSEDTEPSEHTLDSEEDAPSDPAAAAEESEPNQEDESSQPKKEYVEDRIQPDTDADADLADIDGTDIFEEDGAPLDTEWLEDRFVEAGITPVEKSRYQRECYLKYGYEDIDARIRAEGVRNYLRIRGFTNNTLTKSRLRSVADKKPLDLKATNTCDFCFMPLIGISYEKMTDGRIRCRDCSTSSIESIEEARDLYYKVCELLGCFFGIRFNVPIGVKLTDANTIARGIGMVFRPSVDVAPRVVGYACRKKGNYFLCMENGSPRLAFLDTLVHELTHIWQYINWNDSKIEKRYGTGSNRDIVYEGMASWVAIQYMYQIGESSYAELQEYLVSNRDDVYGEGLRLFREKYPFVKDFSMHKFSPFKRMPPL
jgi:hypothetical protein